MDLYIQENILSALITDGVFSCKCLVSVHQPPCLLGINSFRTIQEKIFQDNIIAKLFLSPLKPYFPELNKSLQLVEVTLVLNLYLQMSIIYIMG